jgi:hypothetical protein
MKLRITEIVTVTEYGKQPELFIIEKKDWLGWSEIKSTEIVSKRKSHMSYKDAERYMFHKYFGYGGECKRNGNVYVYTPYTLYL